MSTSGEDEWNKNILFPLNHYNDYGVNMKSLTLSRVINYLRAVTESWGIYQDLEYNFLLIGDDLRPEQI